MKVVATIEEIVLTNENGHEIDSTQATCGRCEHVVESFGTSDASVKRCLALLREECPCDERNFYAVDE